MPEGGHWDVLNMEEIEMLSCTWSNLLQVLRSQVIGEQRLVETTTEKVLITS